MGSLLRIPAILCSVIVALGFAVFAVDEMTEGSKTQQEAIVDQTHVPEQATFDPAPLPEDEALRQRQQGGAREAIDDANDVLLFPFADLVSSNSDWVKHGVPALIALLIYGLGLGMLANYLPKTRTHAGDWRAA